MYYDTEGKVKKEIINFENGDQHKIIYHYSGAGDLFKKKILKSTHRVYSLAIQ